jgi:LruC domain-containing protein
MAAKSWSLKRRRFTPAKETVRIDLEYPDFAKWVESNGATNNDWYLYYQSSKE